MAYISSNPKTKKALREQIANDEPIYVFQPGGWFPLSPDVVKHGFGYVVVEGPHNPEPHRWYGCVEYDLGTLEVLRVVDQREMTKLYGG
jgi:hypothetical protein